MAKERLNPIWWPSGGIITRYAYQTQPPYSTPQAINVRPDSAGVPSGASRTSYIRERGGTRPGLGKAFSQQLGSGNPIRMLNSLTWIESNAIRTRLIAIANGQVWEEEPSGTMAVASTPGTFNTAKNLQSAERNQILYIADHADDTTTSGTTYQPKKFSPLTSAVSNWTAATAGTIPKGCPLICNYRDRLILAGGTTAPHLVSASRQGDPEDWDTSETDSGAAWTLATGDAGILGDIVTALIPHTADCLVLGCSTSIEVVMGDLGFGGNREVLTKKFGIVDKGAYCHTPDGWIVFLSQDGLKGMPAGCGAARNIEDLSRPKIPEELLVTDPSTTSVAMEYDIRDRGIHIFLTPLSAGSAASGHWWFDWDTKSFWRVTLGDADYEPYVVHERKNFVASSASHSTVMLGCRDGYIRRHQNDLVTDDSTAFSSEVWLGPFGDPTLMNDTFLMDVMGVLARLGGKATWSVHPGTTPEEAFNASARESGIWEAGRNNVANPRVSAQSFYLKLVNADNLGWGFETGSLKLSTRGRTRP